MLSEAQAMDLRKPQPCWWGRHNAGIQSEVWAAGKIRDDGDPIRYNQVKLFCRRSDALEHWLVAENLCIKGNGCRSKKVV